MFAVLRHSPTLVGGTIGVWATLPANELPGFRGAGLGKQLER